MHPSTQAVISSFQQLLKQSTVSKIQLQKKYYQRSFDLIMILRVTQQNDPQNSLFINHVIGKEICLNAIKAGYCWGEWIVTKSNLAKGFLHLFLHYSIKGGEAILDDQYFLFSNTLTEVEIRKLLHKQHKDHPSASSGV